MSALKVGLVGAGAIASLHAESWLRFGTELRVWSRSTAEAFAATYEIVACRELAELLQWADVIDVCTPTSSHRDYALVAVAAGRHVLCEKPLARTVDDASSMVRAASGAGVQLYPAHVVRFFTDYAEVRAAVMGGEVGRPAVLRFSRGSAAPVSEWFFDDAISGGIVMDQMIHDLDQARWIAGEVVEIYGVQDPPTVNGVGPPSVVAHLTLTHEAGAVSDLRGSWGPTGTPFQTSVSVSGDRGILRRSSVPPTGEPADRQGTDADYLPARSAQTDPYLSQIREFAEAFAGGPTPRVSAADGVVAVALAEAARTSIRSGEPVRFDTAAVLAGLQDAVVPRRTEPGRSAEVRSSAASGGRSRKR